MISVSDSYLAEGLVYDPQKYEKQDSDFEKILSGGKFDEKEKDAVADRVDPGDGVVHIHGRLLSSTESVADEKLEKSNGLLSEERKEPVVGVVFRATIENTEIFSNVARWNQNIVVDSVIYEQKWYAINKLSYIDTSSALAGNVFHGFNYDIENSGALPNINSPEFGVASYIVPSSLSGQNQIGAIKGNKIESPYPNVEKSKLTNQKNGVMQLFSFEILKKRYTFINGKKGAEIYVRDYSSDKKTMNVNVLSVINAYESIEKSINSVTINGHKHSKNASIRSN